jgi:hypothetical protein
LHLTNFAGNALTLRRLEGFDAAAKSSERIAAFEAEQLDTLLQPVGLARHHLIKRLELLTRV